MKTLRLSDETYRAAQGAARGAWNAGGSTRRPDGSWDVPMGDETVERLERQRLPGEDDDNLVRRVLRAATGEKLQ